MFDCCLTEGFRPQPELMLLASWQWPPSWQRPPNNLSLVSLLPTQQICTVDTTDLHCGHNRSALVFAPIAHDQILHAALHLLHVCHALVALCCPVEVCAGVSAAEYVLQCCVPCCCRYRSHEALLSAMSCLRPETCAKLATSMASCLAVACENMANQDRYSIKPVGDHWWGWEYQYEPFRK